MSSPLRTIGEVTKGLTERELEIVNAINMSNQLLYTVKQLPNLVAKKSVKSIKAAIETLKRISGIVSSLSSVELEALREKGYDVSVLIHIKMHKDEFMELLHNALEKATSVEISKHT